TVGEGIYIILSGEAVVLSEGEEQQAIAHIMEGEFFGEVSCFFGSLCTATVMTVAKAKLLFLRKDMLATVLQLRLDPGNKEEQLKWFVARRYLPTTDLVQKDLLEFQIIVECLKTVPLFSVWPDEALESVALNMAEPMIIVYPPGACILRKGDPADPLLVLLRGRVMIMENEKNVQEVKSRRLAFTFGEEGLFTGSEKMLTVKAVTCCQVIQLRRHLLFKVVRQVNHPFNGLDIIRLL
ncbi:cGMP-dependent protein kinase 1-like, partial [Lingula anatina]|uniref:cGMP-dependent protein kinase 1-like n=1 Tax=Lingula anatina TaxID=7574 RepID=A0A1S3K578_LINAN